MSRRLARRLTAAAVVVAALTILDVESKEWAVATLRPRGPRVVVDGHVSLRYRENPGAMFGLLRSAPERVRTTMFIATSSAAALITTVLLVRRLRRDGAGIALPVGLLSILAGTLGNLHCRLDRGWVIDFIEWRVAGQWKWPVFNLADVFIFIGMLLCLLHLVLAGIRVLRLPDEDPVPPAAA